MKRLNVLFFVVIISFMLSGCATHMGYMNSSAALGDNNFTYAQKHISGSAKTTYILGIGGLGKEALVDEAKQNMLANYELKPGQSIANITVNWKTSFFFVVWSAKCTVTADIVEFK